jgi:hypothetical protein
MPFITQGKTNWKFILIIIILAVIVGGEALWYVKRPEKLYQPPEIKKSEMADWKTYRNEEYGFEMKYPEDWLVQDSVFVDPVNRQDFISKGIEPLTGAKFTSLDNPVQTVSATVYNNSNNYNLDEWLRIYQETSPVGPSFLGQIDEFTIDENKGTKGWFGCCMTYKQTAFLTKGNKTYQIEGGTRNLETGTYDYETIFNQMLSSFRFNEELIPQRLEDCKFLENSKQSCYEKFIKNPKDCKKIEEEDIYYKDVCYFHKAESIEDCSMITVAHDYWRDPCYADNAKKLNDCELIKDDSYLKPCYVSVAVNLQDISICEKIERYDYSDIYKGIDVKPHEREYCYWKVAEAKGDSSICEKIEPLLYRNVCYFNFAYSLKDSSMCEKVKNTDDYVNEKKICYHIATKYNEPLLLKAYKNETYNYQLDYPEDNLIYESEDRKIVSFQSVEEIMAEKTIPLVINSYTGVQKDGYTFEKSAFGISNWKGIAIEETETSKSLEEWLKDKWKLKEKFGLEEFKVGRIDFESEIMEIIIRDGLKGYVLSVCGHHCTSSGYYFKYGKMIIRAELEKEILSTFRFLE